MPVETVKLQRNFAAHQVQADIIGKIEAGELKTGEALLSTNDMARIYGLSYVTVHRALKDLVDQGYLCRLNGKGTFVAERRRSSCIKAVGIPVRMRRNPFHAFMIEEISRQAMHLGIHPIFGEGSREEEFVERLQKDGITAMIRFPFRAPAAEAAVCRFLQQQGMNAVVINDFWGDGNGFPSVRTDERAGFADMTEHLLSLGHRDIVFLDEDEAERRNGAFDGYRRALWKRGVPVRPELTRYIYDYEGTVTEPLIDDLLRLGSAAIVTYDIYALQIAQCLRERGLAVGRDFSLAGFDGIQAAAEYGLSTVCQPVTTLVARAFELLLEGDDHPVSEVIRPDCIFRESTGSYQKNEIPIKEE